MAAGRWRVLAASVCGTSHQQRGQPCQDAHCWTRLPGGLLAVAVADGAGTAVLGQTGAALAANTAINTLVKSPRLPGPSAEDDWANLLSGVFSIALGAIDAEARGQRVNLRDLATTLILVVATPDMIVTAQVGDGAAVIDDGLGSLIPLTCLPSSEYIDQTNFLTFERALESIQTTVWRGRGRRLAVLSDGLQGLALKMPEGRPHPPFFTPFFNFVEATDDEAAGQAQLATFLRSPRVTDKVDDDLTLVLASRLDF